MKNVLMRQVRCFKNHIGCYLVSLIILSGTGTTYFEDIWLGYIFSCHGSFSMAAMEPRIRRGAASDSVVGGVFSYPPFGG